MTLNSQIKFTAQSTKSKIAKALEALLNDMPQFNYVGFDRVRLLASDFREDELPAVQFIDLTETIQHKLSLAVRTWSVSLEVVHKSTENEYINQSDLWDLEYQISRKIWANPNLGVKGVQQCVYTGNTTDLHLLEPFYLLRMDFDILYNEHLVRDC